VAALVRDALRFFDGERYDLYAWCIMPNHVHVVVQPRPGFGLTDILHSWKSFSGSKANQLLGRQGEFWQAESFDHLIRDESDLKNQIRYVQENPEKAGLKDWRFVSRGIGSQPMSHRRAADDTALRSPGQLPTHYAPKTPLRLIEDATVFSTLKDLTVGLLAWKSAPKNYAAVRILSETGDLREAAANLFRYLRELDSLNLDLIIAEKLPETGLGAAINDRLRRAQGTGTPPLS
jgi:REP element-mobilizing transposase RayT